MDLREEWGGSRVGCFILAEDSVVLRANATALLWLNYRAEEIVGRPLHTVLGSGGQFFLQSQILPMLKLKGGLEEIYLRMREKSGTTVPVLVNAARLEEAGFATIEFSFVRIRQRGKLEDELVQAKKLSEQANDAKTKFLGMMSHELRTPLQAISLSNQVLLSGQMGALDGAQKELLESSQDAVRSVAALVDDILNFAQMQGGPVQVKSEAIQMRHALDRAETGIRHRMEPAGLHYERGTDGDGLMARGDPNRLQQILLNLLNNAIKFTPRNGSVRLSGRRSDGFAVFEVSDTGCGIPTDQLERIFEPFVQLHTAIESTEKPGVGLGLAICRDLAQAMGGSMHVVSTLGLGSNFSVSLPLADVQG